MATLNITPAPIIWIDDTSGNIGTVNLDTGAATLIGSSGEVLSDIAFSPSEQLFGETYTTLYSINQTTGAATLIGGFGGILQLNGLVFGSDGTLYGSGGTGLYTINTTTGAATLVGNSGLDLSSAGDLAFLGGTLYETVTDGSVSDLVRINPTTGAGTLVGEVVGDPDLYGLVTGSNGVLYGVDGTNIYAINTTTGSGTLVQSYAGSALGSADGAASQTEAVVCFLSGTRIATPQGEVPVEQLAVGNAVLTHTGTFQRIIWIGQGHVLATRGQRTAATPVIVRKHALAHNVPNRDLRITKAHALYLDDVLIPVEFLVNHRTILWDDHAQEVLLYHIELETHAVLLANGAPAESFRDDGNRWLFQNAETGWGLPPQPPCAPVLTGGPIVDAVWRRLLDRAGPRPGVPTTDDPDLHLLVDGRRIGAASSTATVHRFRLPARPITLRIASRTGVPQELGLSRDPRCLGVAVRHITIRQGTTIRTIRAEDSLLTEGFHGFEPDNEIRWTNGDAAVPAQLFQDLAGPLEIAVTLGGSTTYFDEGILQRVA